MSAVETHILDISMAPPPEPEEHGHATKSTNHDTPKCWLTYSGHAVRSGEIDFDEVDRIGTEAPEGSGVDQPSDRSLDFDVRRQRGRARFLFRVAADYTDHKKPYTLRFDEKQPFFFGADNVDLSGILENPRVSDCRRMASFEFDTASLGGWDIAEHLRNVNCPVVRVPFRFNLIDSQFPFPSWMMPEPGDTAYDTQSPLTSAESIVWHGGPHPPINSFLAIPTGA